LKVPVYTRLGPVPATGKTPAVGNGHHGDLRGERKSRIVERRTSVTLKVIAGVYPQSTALMTIDCELRTNARIAALGSKASIVIKSVWAGRPPAMPLCKDYLEPAALSSPRKKAMRSAMRASRPRSVG
jgi:hypothetical protein